MKSRLVILFLLLCRICFAQFGVEQPFFGGVNLTLEQQAEAQLMAIAQYRWVAGDLADGSFTTWTDRVQGASMRLDTSIPSRWIMKNTNGVVFEGKGADGLVVQHMLTNATLNWRSNSTVAFILNRPLQWSHYLKTPSGVANTQPFLWANTNGVNPYAGFQFGDGDVQNASGALFHNVGFGGPQLSLPGFGSNGWSRLVCSQFFTNTTGYGVAWTNGAQSYSNILATGQGGFQLTHNGGPHYLGFAYNNLSTCPTMFVQEIWVLTNAGYSATDGAALSSTNLGFFEQYSTNRYSVVTSNEWAYSPIGKYDAALGVLNTSDVPAANGDKVKTWNNQAPPNWPLTQLGPNTLRPYWVSSGGPNNLPYLTFPSTNSTSNSRLTNSYSIGVAGFQTNMVFMVLRFFDYGRAFQLFLDNSAGSSCHIGTANDLNLRYFQGGSGQEGPNTVPTNTWMLVTMVWDAANSFMRTNGVTYKTGTTGTATYQGFSVGSAVDGTTPAVFDLAELRVYSRGNMTSNDMHTVEAELGSKFGFTIP